MMLAHERPLGCSGLMRVAGLPARFWLAGANPPLFRKVEQLDRAETERRSRAVQLAEQIGRKLVPSPALAREDRAFLLAVRRALHREQLIEKVSRERFLKLSALTDVDEGLLWALAEMVDGDCAIAMLSAEVEADLVREQERLLQLNEQIYHESPVARALRALDDPAGPTLGPLRSQKSLRRRCEHEWRRVARAAAVTTPRGWLSQVALLPIESTVPLVPAVTAQFTAQWTENVRSQRLALADSPDDWPAPESRLFVNPLRWDVDDRLVCVVLDEKREHSQVAVRRTSFLDAICTALADAVHTFQELAQSLGCVNQDEWSVLRGFVRHLVVLGILQPSTRPEVRLERKATPGQTFSGLADDKGNRNGWVDVYRYSETGLSENVVRDLQRGVSQALRLLSLVGDGMPKLPPEVLSTSEHSWSLIEVLRDKLDAGPEPVSTIGCRELIDDLPIQPSSTSFDKLDRAIGERAERAAELFIDSSLLDAWGAANEALAWPVDCLVRVPSEGADFMAILDDLWPPGMLDARFVDTLEDIHGLIPHVETYRAFLRQVEQSTGILFVEMLLPPLQNGAANAVRRPVYTSAWTGDPDIAPYLRAGADLGRYIPINAIKIRRIDGRLRAEIDGQPIWPIYHATRSFSPPWDRLAWTLLSTAPLALPWDFQRMKRSLVSLPKLRAVPRILLSGGVVLFPAQWWVTPDQLWDREAPATMKLRALIRLRDQWALPRWVYLVRNDDNSSVPCDLESIHSISVIERCAKDNSPLHITEMLPTPEQLVVIDRSHDSEDRLAAQFHLRFPFDESATAMATRISPAVFSALGSPGSTQTSRGPPAAGALRTAEVHPGKER